MALAVGPQAPQSVRRTGASHLCTCEPMSCGARPRARNQPWRIRHITESRLHNTLKYNDLCLKPLMCQVCQATNVAQLSVPCWRFPLIRAARGDYSGANFVIPSEVPRCSAEL